MNLWTRRDFFALTAVATASLSAGRAASQAIPRRPNIVVVLTDDQGYGDVGIHGNEHLKTPHLDRFASEGVRFTRFYCSPVCAPTRASLMTGRFYYRTGVIHTSRGGAKMHGDEVTMAELLRDSGYTTGIFGKWHLGDNYPMRPQDQGFDECLIHKSGGIGQTPDKPNSYFDPFLWENGRRVQTTGYCTDIFFEAALDFISAHRGDPFFVYLPTNAPHTPLEVDPKLAEPYRAIGLDDDTAKIYGMVANLDENMGRLLARLDELGLRENTLIVFLGDNGPQQQRYTGGLRGRKTSTYEGGIRVPCFLQWPGGVEGARTLDRIAAHIDLFPTILAACGIQKPDDLHLDGRTLMPLLQGESAAWPERRLFFQCHRGLTPHRYQNCSVVTQRYKLVGNPGTFTKEQFEPTPGAGLELYDLEQDPGEQDDLAGAHPEKVAELRAAYDAWFDDVQSTRGFTPGRMHIGSDKENPAHLCRYQDAQYLSGKPVGWPVKVERAGTYELTINRGDPKEPGEMHVVINGKEHVVPVAAGSSRATVELPKGDALLRIWCEGPGCPPADHWINDTLGDVGVRWLGGGSHRDV